MELRRSSQEDLGFALHNGRLSKEFRGFSWPFDNFCRINQDLHRKDLLKIRIITMMCTWSWFSLPGWRLLAAQ